MTPKQLAAELNTDPKTCRRFLRSLTANHAGKGGRWEIDVNDLPALRLRFADFTSRRTTILSLDD